MSYDSSYAINLSLLKKCRKRYSIIFYYVIISSAFIFIYGFLNLLSISPDIYILKATENTDNIISPNYIALFVDALIVVPISLYFGLRLTISQHDLSALLNIFLFTTNIIVFFVKKDWGFLQRVPIAFVVFMLYSTAGIFFSIIGLVTNHKYHWLEEQDGFPHFNERMVEYDNKKRNWDKHNPFIEQRERLKKTAQDHMDDLPQLSPEQLKSLGGTSGEFIGKDNY